MIDYDDIYNPNNPRFKGQADYVYSGGQWQYRGDGTHRNISAGSSTSPVDPNAPAAGGRVSAESLGTLGGWAGLFGKGSPATVSASIPNAQHWQDITRAGAVRQQGVNPYNAGVADQSRPAQLALMQQMRGQMDGPSIANMQGQRAMGQMGQQALMQGGRAGVLGAAQSSAGLAGDVGQARLAENMRAQAGVGGAAGNLRGADLRSADAQMGAGFAAQNIADQRAKFYGSTGANLGVAQDRLGLENFKLNERLKQEGMKSNADGINDYLSLMASIFSMGAGAGKGKK